jgi:O-antigen/teichoic acid export membrane protein
MAVTRVHCDKATLAARSMSETPRTGVTTPDPMSEAVPPPLGDFTNSALPWNFRRNVMANYGNIAALLVVSLLTTPLLAHGLGAERFGIWAMVGAIIPYLEILELGFAATTVTMTARHIASGDSRRVEAIVNTSLFVLVVPGLACFALACGVAAVLPHIVDIVPSQVVPARILILLLGFDMAVSIPGDTFGGGLVALQRFDLLNASLAAVTVVPALGWFVVIHQGGGLVALGVVTVTVSFVGQLGRYVMFRRLLPDLRISLKAFDRHVVRSFARLSGWFSVADLLGLTLVTVDVVIVGALVGVVEAGVFAVGQRLATLAANSVSPVTDLLAPASAQSVGMGDIGRLRALVTTGNRVVMGVAIPVALVTAVLARPALRAWVGPLYEQATLVVVFLCAAAVTRASTQSSRSVLYGEAEPKIPTLIGTASAAVHIGLAVLLGMRYGIVGVASAAFISSFLFDFVAMSLFVSRRYRITIFSYLAQLGRSHLVPVLASGAVGFALAHGPLLHYVRTHGRVVGIVAVVVAGLVMLAVYLPLYAFMGLSAEERGTAVARVRVRMRRGSSK